jgi:hypothetical protein
LPAATARSSLPSRSNSTVAPAAGESNEATSRLEASDHSSSRRPAAASSRPPGWTATDVVLPPRMAERSCRPGTVQTTVQTTTPSSQPATSVSPSGVNARS